jgi:hypothetical protein
MRAGDYTNWGNWWNLEWGNMNGGYSETPL